MAKRERERERERAGERLVYSKAPRDRPLSSLLRLLIGATQWTLLSLWGWNTTHVERAGEHGDYYFTRTAPLVFYSFAFFSVSPSKEFVIPSPPPAAALCYCCPAPPILHPQPCPLPPPSPSPPSPPPPPPPPPPPSTVLQIDSDVKIWRDYKVIAWKSSSICRLRGRLGGIWKYSTVCSVLGQILFRFWARLGQELWGASSFPLELADWIQGRTVLHHLHPFSTPSPRYSPALKTTHLILSLLLSSVFPLSFLLLLSLLRPLSSWIAWARNNASTPHPPSYSANLPTPSLHLTPLVPWRLLPLC